MGAGSSTPSGTSTSSPKTHSAEAKKSSSSTKPTKSKTFSSSSTKKKNTPFDTRTPEQKHVAWVHFQRELPRTKSDEDKERRIELFEKFDVTQRGSLTLRETYDGCKKVLFLHDFTPRLPDIVDRAFNKAKDMGNKIEGTGDESMVEFLEFRLMLCYIYDYFKLTEMFDDMDTSGNMLITLTEFAKAAPAMEAWGLQVGDPTATFRKIDSDGSGQITFNEFAAWANPQKKEMDDEFGTAPPVSPSKVPVTEQYTESSAAKRGAAWARIREIIPRRKTAEDKTRRIELFQQFDKDGRGSLTLAETYKGCVRILHLDEFTHRLKDIVKRAYKKAKSLGTKDRNAGDANQVEFLEFRLMLCYIYDYFELTVMFDEIDTSGNMLIDENEFKQAASKIEEWGLKMEDPEKVFKEIDANGSGSVTFDEFAAWASAKKLDADGDPDNIH